MKNYKKSFEKANKALIRGTKVLIGLVGIITVLIIPTLIFAMGMRLYFHSYSAAISAITNLNNSYWFCYILILLVLIVISIFVSADPVIRLCSKKLQKQANEFVMNTYLPDLMNALESKFTLTNSFKTRLIKIMEICPWLDESAFDPDGSTLDYENDEELLLTIEHEKCTYYLAQWLYSPTLSFTFIFDKVDAEGKIERNIEFQLPVKK